MKTLRRNIGYTIDQTILIVAIIAILITLVIATVGWDIITRAGGTKLAAQMRQVEDSVGQFYATHQVWPHQASTQGNSRTAQPLILANAGTGYTLNGNIDASSMRNMLAGFELDGSNLRHDFGSSGEIRIAAGQAPSSANIGTNIYTIVQFNEVPINEAEEADEIIDGSIDSQAGRLFYRPSSACLNDGTFSPVPGGSAIPAGTANVHVCYAANIIQ